MTNRITKLLAATLLSFTVGSQLYADGFSGEVVPASIEVIQGQPNYFLIRFTPVEAAKIINNDGCVTDTWALRTDDAQYRKEMMAIVLSAIASGSKLNGWLVGCTEAHWDASVQLTNVRNIMFSGN